MEEQLKISESIDREPAFIGRGLFDCPQAACYLNLSESYIRKAVAANRIPYVRIGSRTLFRKSDLDEWIASQLVPTESQNRESASRIAATIRLQRSRRNGL